MKKLISKVLLALITLSVAAPVCAGVDLAMVKSVGSIVKKGAIFGLSGLGGAAVGGIVRLVLRVVYMLNDLKQNPSKYVNQVKEDGLSDDEFDQQYRERVRMDNIFMYGGALLGACAGIYLASRR